MRGIGDRIARGTRLRGPRAYVLMAAIALSGGLLTSVLQHRTPHEREYGKLADRLDRMAAEYRAVERRARAGGDFRRAQEARIRADHLESQGRLYRRESYHRWEWSAWRWPESWPWRSRRSA